jgi:pimeloyl-ACP methyl ester carboxylesterase
MTSPHETLASPQPRRRNRWVLWTVRVLLGLLALIVLLAASGATYEAIMAVGDTKRYPPPGQLVDVGGHRLHVHCVGQGSPTVVLDAGLGAFSLDWGAVQPEIATTTRVCAYDRAGLGWSEPGPRPRSPQQFADELHTLLTNAGIQGPYVLVTHSISGKTARLFASQHPNQAAGMVLIDARHESVDDHLTPEQVAAEDAQQQQFQDMIKWMARFGLVRLLWAPAWPSMLPGSENLSPRAGPQSASCRNARSRSRALWLRVKAAWRATLCFERRRRLATNHSSSWRRPGTSITCHSGRRHSRPWHGCHLTAV